MLNSNQLWFTWTGHVRMWWTLQVPPPQASELPSSRNTLDWLAERLALLVVLSLLPVMLGWLDWRMELGRVLTMQALALSLLALVPALLRRRLRLAAALLLACLVHGHIVLETRPQLAPPDRPAPLRLLVANIWAANARHQSLAQLIKTFDPDVIGLIEVNARWITSLEEPLRGYGKRLEIPRRDAFGIAMYARTPGVQLESFQLQDAPALSLRLPPAMGGLEILLAHTLPPKSSRAVRIRDAQLRDLTARTRAAEHPVLVAGDLNVTPYNRTFADLLGWGGLQRAGPWLGSWPTMWPLPLRVPIDQILGTEGVRARVALGPALGSDHLPLLVHVQPPAP